MKAGAEGFLVRESGPAKPVQILQIQVSRQTVPEATVGALVGLLLQGADKSDIKPGDTLQSSPEKTNV